MAAVAGRTVNAHPLAPGAIVARMRWPSIEPPT
jgi:hypothetical protein